MATAFKDNAETKGILAIGKALESMTLTSQKRTVDYFKDLVDERYEAELNKPDNGTLAPSTDG